MLICGKFCGRKNKVFSLKIKFIKILFLIFSRIIRYTAWIISGNKNIVLAQIKGLYRRIPGVPEEKIQ